MTPPAFARVVPTVPAPSPDPCSFCGRQAEVGSTARCAVCGMGLGPSHFPHILRIESGHPPAHFCSLACMDNYEHMEAE